MLPSKQASHARPTRRDSDDVLHHVHQQEKQVAASLGMHLFKNPHRILRYAAHWTHFYKTSTPAVTYLHHLFSHILFTPVHFKLQHDRFNIFDNDDYMVGFNWVDPFSSCLITRLTSHNFFKTIERHNTALGFRASHFTYDHILEQYFDRLHVLGWIMHAFLQSAHGKRTTAADLIQCALHETIHMHGHVHIKTPLARRLPRPPFCSTSVHHTQELVSSFKQINSCI